VAQEGRLHIHDVTIARRDDQSVYISQGLADGDQVIVSALDTVSDGMEIRTEPQTEEPTALEGEPADDRQ
jgi:multidrug efflux pump subunit AcrA (membrane-fusion protein)